MSAYEDPGLSPVLDEPGNTHWTEYAVLKKIFTGRLTLHWCFIHAAPNFCVQFDRPFKFEDLRFIPREYKRIDFFWKNSSSSVQSGNKNIPTFGNFNLIFLLLHFLFLNISTIGWITTPWCPLSSYLLFSLTTVPRKKGGGVAWRGAFYLNLNWIFIWRRKCCKLFESIETNTGFCADSNALISSKF